MSLNLPNKIRIVFFGTPDFSIPSLKILAESEQFEVIAVVTQTEKPKGRGKQILETPVAREANKLGITQILSPKTLSGISENQGRLEAVSSLDEDLVKLCAILNSKPDFCIVVAYGKIIPLTILKSGNINWLNVHPSTLPRWRGAAPLQHTIFAGDKFSSVCIIELVKELDSGPIYSKLDFQIENEETYGSLHEKTRFTGAKLLFEAILDIHTNRTKPTEQSIEGITYANKWTKADCKINWLENAETCVNRIRASSPKPGAFTFFEGKILKIHSAKIHQNKITSNCTPGALSLSLDGNLLVKCNENTFIEIIEIQREGKNKINSNDFLNTNRLREKLTLKETVLFADN